MTMLAPSSRAARVGTCATRPPSARQRVPIWTGSNKPGKAQLARIASHRFPWVKTTGSPLARSVATTAMGICRSSKLARFEYPFDQVAEAVIAGQAQPGNAPSGDVAKTKRSASGYDARERRAAGVGRAEECCQRWCLRCKKWGCDSARGLAGRRDARIHERTRRPEREPRPGFRTGRLAQRSARDASGRVHDRRIAIHHP